MGVAAVIGLCGVLQGELVFLVCPKRMHKLWEETINKKDLSYIMVTLKGRFKVNTADNWQMLPLLYTT